MTPILPLTGVRVDPRAVPATALDRYVRNEYRDRDAAWFVDRIGPTNGSNPSRRQPNGGRLLLRAARAIAAFV
jgi:hypothetical protein